MLPVFYLNAKLRYRASCELALHQLNTWIDQQNVDTSRYATAFAERASDYNGFRQRLLALESPTETGVVEIPYFTSRLRHHMPSDVIYVMEAVTSSVEMIHHLNLTKVCLSFFNDFRRKKLTRTSLARKFLCQWCWRAWIRRWCHSRCEVSQTGLVRLWNVRFSSFLQSGISRTLRTHSDNSNRSLVLETVLFSFRRWRASTGLLDVMISLSS